MYLVNKVNVIMLTEYILTCKMLAQHGLGRSAGVRRSGWKSQFCVGKRWITPLWVGSELLPQAKEFKYLLFTSEGKMEMDRRIGAAPAEMWALYQTIVVKRELSQKAKLSIYQLIYVPTPTCGHELWVVTERMRSQMQGAEMSFLHRVSGLCFRDKVRSSDTWRELGVEPLLLRVKRSQLRWFRQVIRILLEAFLWRFSGHVQLVGDPRLDPKHAGGITYLIRAGTASGSPQRSCKILQGRVTSGTACLACCPRDPAPDKQKMDGWMLTSIKKSWNLHKIMALKLAYRHRLHAKFGRALT